MTQQSLFIKPNVVFEKTSAEVGLSEDPNRWPHEVLQELYKQVPYISDFEPHVEMQQVDSERGYGLGQVTLATQSDAQRGTDPTLLEAAGVRSVRIPIVIKERRLCPFDLLVNDVSKVVPLTEARLRTSLFRPQMFDVTAQSPGDTSLVGQLYPPYRQGSGMGGGLTMDSGLGKHGSALERFLGGEKKAGKAHPTETLIKDLEGKDCGFRKVAFRKTASLCTATFFTYHQSDLNRFFEKLAADEGLQAAYARNTDAVMGPLSLFANEEPLSLEKRAEALTAAVAPSVTQLTKTASGYAVKKANYAYWKPTTSELSRWEALQEYGDKVVLAADTTGQVTLAAGTAPAPTEAGPLDLVSPESVSVPGLYRVTTDEGQELVGVVVPNLLDVDGMPLPLALFTNGSHTSVQPDILGVPAGEGMTLPVGEPSGAGAFFSRTQGGQLQATIPLTLRGSYTAKDEPMTFQGETFDGRPVEVSVQPNIQTILGTPEGKMLIPAHWQWTPLGAAAAVGLLSTESSNALPDEWRDDTRPMPELDEDTDEWGAKESQVCIRGGHDCFSFEGPAVEKLAKEERSMVGVDQAMFLLAGLGVDQGYGVAKLAQAMSAPQLIKTARSITPAALREEQALRQAAKYAQLAPNIRQDLMKEAAVIPDPTAVDAVLSLGFINPENIMTYVSYLPTFEDAQAKMCELLLGSRLGLSEVPTSALERAVRSTEEAIEGLKSLAFQG